MPTYNQRSQIATRILFIVMLVLGIVTFLFSLFARLFIPALVTLEYWPSALGIGFILIGGIGMYYTRYYQVGGVAMSRFANSGMEIIMIAGICIIGVVMTLIGLFGFINWLRIF